jgi:iron complex transport system ATP-binding protein
MPYRASYGGFDSDEDLAAADEAIGMLELEPLRHEPITRLSGGELQRVMIAKAVAQGTGTVVLDEPNTHLDISHQQAVLEILRQRAISHSVGIIASIHDLNLAAMFCDSIVVVAAGRTLCQGPPRDVLNAELLQRTFGVELQVEPAVYGDAPGIRYRFMQEKADEP